MGSFMKGSQRGNSSSNNNSSTNKPYALMLLLAFGAAILGVMVLHKLREKRIFTLLVKEKDHELLTLHLLFQREKEFNQEARKKIEEMKNKVYSLRTQKLELDRRLLEMESTISALKDERKVIESTLEEKRNEIQMLASGTNSSTRDLPRLTALRSMIKMRDEEIEDLKFHLKQRNDLQSDRPKLETTSTSVGTRQENKHDDYHLLHSSNSFSNSTKGNNRNQNDDNIRRANEHIIITEPEKLNKVKDAEVHFNRGITENEERLEKDFHGNQDDTVMEEHKKATSANHDEEQHRLRMRRKHSKGRKRETLQNRKLGDDEQPNLEMHQDEKANTENEKELGREDKLASSHKLNQKSESGDHHEAREEAEKFREEEKRKPTEIKSNGTDTGHLNEHGSLENVETKLVTNGGQADKDDVEENVRKQITDEVNNNLNYQEANINEEIPHSIEAKKHDTNNDNEQGNTNEESEIEDSEDAEIHEPEIDRDDIRRFSESDPDEEAEETEF